MFPIFLYWTGNVRIFGRPKEFCFFFPNRQLSKYQRLHLSRISCAHRRTLRNGCQIPVCSASPIASPPGPGGWLWCVTASAQSPPWVQSSPKVTKHIKQGLGCWFFGLFFFSSPIPAQTLTTVMHLFFLSNFQMQSHNNSLEKKKILEAIWSWICFLFWARRSG